jgi:CubicO group peptidase (beta-lactamase class C family)
MLFYHTPGVSIAYIQDYKMQWARGFGIEKAGSEQKVTPTTIFEAASTTKFLNAILILRLVEQGLLSLTEDVNSYLSSWARIV